MTHYPPPPGRDPRQSPPQQGSDPRYAPGAPRDPGYNYGAAPGRGFTPPVYSSQPQGPPLQGMAAAAQRYFGLQRRARANSMSWWSYKLLQGALISVPLVLLGIVIALSATLVGGSQWITGIGILVVLSGLAVLLRYALAPLTCKWIVIVPESHYWVVEDGNGFTLRFLRTGHHEIAWNWNVRVKDYVNFTWVSIAILETNVLPPDGPVDVEVGVMMRFEPQRAALEQYADLRDMNRRETVERLLARATRAAARDTLQRRPPHERAKLLGQKSRLEEIILQRLAPLTSWGLFPAAGRPVSVFVDGLPQDAYDDNPYADPYEMPRHAPQPPADPTVVRSPSETRIGQNMQDTIYHEEPAAPETAAPQSAGGGSTDEPPTRKPPTDDMLTDPMMRRSKWKEDKGKRDAGEND
jgi:hypothetical protein